MANGNVCYVLGRNKFSGIFQTRKVLEEEHMIEMKTLEERI